MLISRHKPVVMLLLSASHLQTHYNRYPEINLYHSDGKHPSLAGTYLAASVFFATLYNKSPVGGALPVDSDMTPETAEKLQIIAWGDGAKLSKIMKQNG